MLVEIKINYLSSELLIESYCFHEVSCLLRYLRKPQNKIQYAVYAVTKDFVICQCIFNCVALKLPIIFSKKNNNNKTVHVSYKALL